MKTKLVLIALMFFSLTSFSQSSIITKYFTEFADNDDFTKVTINSKMFSLFTELDVDSEDEKDFVEAVSKIKGLKLIACDSVGDAASLYEKACKDIDNDGYEELMTVVDGNENMKFSIIEKDGIISELIMVVGGKRNFVLLSLYGEINLKDVSKMARSMKIDGLENLQKIEEAHED